MNETSHLLFLPPELIDQVIRENDGDPPTLRSCALVCRAFLPFTQAYIFSEVELIPDKASRAEQLQHVLVDSPHLRSHIKTLKISDAGIGNWLPRRQILAGILDLLDAVTSFALVFEIRDTSDHWRNLPREIRTAICGLCQRSQLTSLRLMSLRTVTDLAELTQLVASPALTTLCLWDISLPILTEGDLASLNKHLRLNDCRFALTNPTLEGITRWLIEGDSFSDVHRLRVSWSLETSSQLQRLTRASMASLRELILHSHDINTLPQDFSDNLSLSKLKNLRILSVSFVIDASHSEILSRLLAKLLEACPQSLTTLEVDLFVVSHPEIDWAPLASVLTTAQFPALENVKFQAMSRLPASDPSEQRFIEGIQRGFPHLQAQGILGLASRTTI
ncbi:hypothetical protein B0H19DRAFT_483914 [Mycena capillaripes]|nr:hypothetical protein B0H19DRAFT_483914 [Mycena capillaripes]